MASLLLIVKEISFHNPQHQMILPDSSIDLPEEILIEILEILSELVNGAVRSDEAEK
mgnify:CR=1 FL=1